MVDSVQGADLFASVVGEGGKGMIITAHKIGEKTSYNLWEKNAKGEEKRLMVEQVKQGEPDTETFLDILAEMYISMPQNEGIEQLLEEVSSRLEEGRGRVVQKT